MSNTRLAPSDPLSSRAAADLVQPRSNAGARAAGSCLLRCVLPASKSNCYPHTVIPYKDHDGASVTRIAALPSPTSSYPNLPHVATYCHLSCVSGHTTTSIPYRLIGTPPLEVLQWPGFGVVLLSIVNQSCRPRGERPTIR